MESDCKVKGGTELKKNIEHVKRKAEDYYWESDNLYKEMQVGEFTISVDELMKMIMIIQIMKKEV